MKNYKESTLENYLFDINIVDELYITLNKDKMNINGDNFRHYTVDAIDVENSIYAIAVYGIGTKTVLTFLENGVTPNSQFLITSDEIIENLKIEDLSAYVGCEIADLVLSYFC